MAPLTTIFLLLVITIPNFLFLTITSQKTQPSPSPPLPPTMFPFSCSQSLPTCKAILYHSFSGHTPQQLSSFYSVPASYIQPVPRNRREDYLITVPCSCNQTVTTTADAAYFYAVSYPVQTGDTFSDVSTEIYNGQVWDDGNEEQKFVAGRNVTLNLLCGCEGEGAGNGDEIVTYTVENGDTLSDIGQRFRSSLASMVSLNQLLEKNNTGFIDVGWVLYVPRGSKGVGDGGGDDDDQPSSDSSVKKLTALIIVLPLTAFLLAMAAFIFVYRRKILNRKMLPADEQRGAAKFRSISTFRTGSSIPKSFKEFTEDFEKGMLDPEGPVLYSIEEIQEATNDFDESKNIGEGGYGLVFFGVLRGKEVAIKVMRSNKSKEFYAEVNVLCKIHHINVVELLGYASDDDHFFLVYEYVRNGSLSDHLHEPMQKDYQPLSWTARTQIAVDAAKGIEYIHDHTKSRYVHRDIKTTNILLNEYLRAKVADFGLAKLVERSSEDELIATRLVGTPGYLPPESVKELQVTSKTDVFGFGVVLAELITGKRALVRDHNEPSRLKSLITTLAEVFESEEPHSALEKVIDLNLRSGYPLEDVYKMAEIAQWCLSEEAANRPEMRDVVGPLAQIVTSSVEWEASMGGDSQVFSGIFNGR
ncbi:LysM domain receptor-like kinase 3 [Linum grandiflorum]